MKAPRLKKQCHSLSYSVLRIWNDQCKHFKCGLPLTATPKWVKRGNKIVIHLCKRTKVKITDIAYIRLLRVRTDQCRYPNLGFTPDRNPKRGNKQIKRGNKIEYIYVKKINAKTSVISYLRVPEYGMTNESNLRVAFTLRVLPKGVKKGVKKVTFVHVKRVKAKTGVTSHLSVPRVRNNQCKPL